MPAKPGRPVLIYFPGNGDFLAGCVGRFGNSPLTAPVSSRCPIGAYAGSSGRPSEQGLLRDAAAAYAFTVARDRANRIVLWGFSLGSGVAVALAADQPVGKLVLEAPYTSMTDIAASLFPIVPVRWLIRDAFRSDQRMASVTAPLLIMHGARDLTIPMRFGQRLFELAYGPKQFVQFPEGGHNDLDNYGAIETALRFIHASKS